MLTLCLSGLYTVGLLETIIVDWYGSSSTVTLHRRDSRVKRTHGLPKKFGSDVEVETDTKYTTFTHFILSVVPRGKSVTVEVRKC